MGTRCACGWTGRRGGEWRNAHDLLAVQDVCSQLQTQQISAHTASAAFNTLSWASAHRGKWGQPIPWKNRRKIKKRKHARKSSFLYVYVIFWEQSGQTGVENGAMLTTYLFRYTSECTISKSDFQKFLRLRRQGGIDPANLTKILWTFLNIVITHPSRNRN